MNKGEDGAEKMNKMEKKKKKKKRRRGNFFAFRVAEVNVHKINRYICTCNIRDHRDFVFYRTPLQSTCTHRALTKSTVNR